MNKFCVRQSYTLFETIERIDSNKNRAVIVLNSDERVIGVISQGDIIRALISGKNIYARIDSIIQPNFLYIDQPDIERAYSIFRDKKVTLLPIVDADYHLIGVINMDDIYRYMEEKCKN